MEKANKIKWYFNAQQKKKMENYKMVATMKMWLDFSMETRFVYSV